MALTCEFYDISETKARFRATFTGGDSGFGGYRYIRLTIYGFGEYQIESTDPGGSSSSFKDSFAGFEKGTRYNWEAQLGYEVSGNIVWLDVYDSGSFTTAGSSVIVEPWSWDASNGNATSVATRTAYNVLMGTENPSEFSHLVWNDLVDKAYEVRSARGYTWDTDGGNYPSVSGCKVSAGETLSARKYNGVRYNIGSILSTGIFDQSPGDKITGYKIYHLTEVLNEIINDL